MTGVRLREAIMRRLKMQGSSAGPQVGMTLRVSRVRGRFMATLATGVAQLSAAVGASGQVGLFVEHGGAQHLVRRIDGATLMFERDGQWVRAERKDRASLRPLNEFLPFVVNLRKVQATSHSTGVRYGDGSVRALGVEVTFTAELESPYPLENVFVLLEIQTAEGPRTVHRGVGALSPGQSRPVLLHAPILQLLGGQPYVVHVFSDGMELLHSEQSEAFREAQLDRIVQRRIAGVQNSDVQALVGPDPVYPATLQGRRITGEAVVRLRVTRNGAAREVELLSATAPEFGAPAIAAAKAWRFLPAVRDGVPQEGIVELPFRFTPAPPK